MQDKTNKEKKYYHIGRNVKFSKEFHSTLPQRIWLEDNVNFSKNVWLCVNAYGHNKDRSFNLKIQDRVFMNRNVIVEAFNYIEIGKYVMFGPNVYICDKSHEYQSIELPIRLQGFTKDDNQLIINDGAWIGSGAKILGNVTIGHGTVIGANSVVTKDIPSHAVVVGTPARVVKIYDYRIDEWVNVNEDKLLLHEILSNRGDFSGYDYNRVREIINEKKH